MVTRRQILTGLTLLVCTAAFHATQAGDAASAFKKAAQSVAEGSKRVGKDIARESKKVGHAVAESSKDVGEKTAQGARTAWFKARDWTTEKSRRVADATIRWWDDVIRSKEEERDRLRKENQRLKR